MLNRTIKTSIFIAMIFYAHCMQAHYQAERCDFDESIRYQFIEDQVIAYSLSPNDFALLPFQPLLQAMLQGSYPYQLLSVSDDTISPYVMIKSTANYAYIIGKPHAEELGEIMQKLLSYKNVAVVCDESLQSYFVQHGFSVQPRIELEYQSDFEVIQKEMPLGFTVKPLDLTLLKQSSWFGFLVSVAGGAKRFLERGFGFALVNEQGFSVAQAYGVFIGDGTCEIGVVTHPDHRGKGYILYPVIATIQECLARNLTPVWSCNSENIASLKTAHKLGFIIKRHYIFLKKN